ncbi:MAG: hypothetical protein E6G95_21975, partial [Alphaproteobacteria bacterium]
ATEHIGVVGGGAWGTALACLARRAGRQVTLWSRDPAISRAIAADRANPVYLPGIALDAGIAAADNLDALTGCDVLLLVCPAQAVRGLPTAVSIATWNPTLGQSLATSIAAGAFRPYWTHDMLGVALGGALKNVLAIAAGIVEGRGLGHNAAAALVTRGFAEMARLGLAMGAELETLTGLSGLGDLVLTCHGPLSRNRALGLAIGKGTALGDYMQGRRQVVEGEATAPAVLARAARQGIEMPI